MSNKEEKRSALLQAALELFAENGFNGSSTALIAKRAGVASGTLFFHFKSKEELIHELFRLVSSKIEKKILENYRPEMALRERYLHTVTAILHYLIDNPDEFKFVEQYHFSPLCKREKSSEENEILREILVEARDQGLIKDAPLLFLESVTFGPVAQLAKEHANRKTPIDGELIRMTAQACWDGLKQ